LVHLPGIGQPLEPLQPDQLRPHHVRQRPAHAAVAGSQVALEVVQAQRGRHAHHAVVRPYRVAQQPREVVLAEHLSSRSRQRYLTALEVCACPSSASPSPRGAPPKTGAPWPSPSTRRWWRRRACPPTTSSAPCTRCLRRTSASTRASSASSARRS